MQPKPLLAAALVGTLFAAGSGHPAHAQDLGSMLKNLANHAAEKVIDQQVNPRRNAYGAQPQGAGPMPQINAAYDFTPGPVTLFQQDFASTAAGAMPADLKTNGSGQVVTVGGFGGRWLELRDGSTYKLQPRIDLPARFTVEFDLIPVAQEINDLNGFHFGFAHDNDVRAYIHDAYNGGSINNISLQYLNGGGGDVYVASSATRYHAFNKVDWRDYANRVTHVAIAVNGDQMQAYLNRMKVVDSRLFEQQRARHFYFSSSFNHRHDARLLVSNLRIGGFDANSATASSTQADAGFAPSGQ